MVSTRTTVGLIGVMARHAPLLATLEPTELRLHKGEGEIARYAQSEAISRSATPGTSARRRGVPGREAGREMLRERLAAASKNWRRPDDDTARRQGALRDKKRWEVFLSLAK